MKELNVILFDLSVICLLLGVVGQHKSANYDAFDQIREKMDKVTEDNCFVTHLNDLYLPEDSVSHHPDLNNNINPELANRTAMLRLHNLAISRAFFWSYILQSRFNKPDTTVTNDPGMLYYFLSSVADVSSTDHISASGIYFSPNQAYTPSYKDFFNKTMARFAPRVYREDNSQNHLNKTLKMFYVKDLGAFEPNSLNEDYTSDSYPTNEWYQLWLHENRNNTKTAYEVEISYADKTNKKIMFYGPPGNNESPVKWTKPYFDCGRSNKWLVAAVSPVVDVYPRHTQIETTEHPIYSAAVVMEMDFNKIDINQCPLSQGNDGPNIFASTARCKVNVTECIPIPGKGFNRGGYQCRCYPGTYPVNQEDDQPYPGEDIEKASADQYNNGFDCKLDAENNTRHEENHSDPSKVFMQVEPARCSVFTPSNLFVNGNISWGAVYQLDTQALTAVRLANFISAFLQVSDPEEVYSGNRVPDKPLTEDQMIGETLAILFGDSKIWAAGIFWDRNKFTNRKYFAPFAYKTELNTRNFKVEDLAPLDDTDVSEETYTNKPWFQYHKQRWSTDFDSLEKFYLKIFIRNDELGHNLKRFERFPTYYRAANLSQEHWTRPYHACDGHLKQTVITYASPFFGWDRLKVKLEFKGVVAVTIPFNT